MVRQIRRSEKVLIVGLGFILLFMMFHDWLPLGPLNDVESVAANRPIGELVIVTLFGTAQIMQLMGMVLFFIENISSLDQALAGYPSIFDHGGCPHRLVDPLLFWNWCGDRVER